MFGRVDKKSDGGACEAVRRGKQHLVSPVANDTGQIERARCGGYFPDPVAKSRFVRVLEG